MRWHGVARSSRLLSGDGRKGLVLLQYGKSHAIAK